uniref:Tumor necrosis factor-inducible gene 6 protein n=1 Tax=Eptatretus burgeri TaxID=7764 RepID=A0A8C4PXM7_EPTBU
MAEFGPTLCLMALLVVLPHTTHGWSLTGDVWRNSILLESAAGVYHRESRQGKYNLTFQEAEAVCRYEGGSLATPEQLLQAQQAGLHNCVAGWLAGGIVGYPIVKPSNNCGDGHPGVMTYGVRHNREEKWDVYCYNPTKKQCGGIFTEHVREFTSPDYPGYLDRQICYWHIRVPFGRTIHLTFSDFQLEKDASCLSDYLAIYDSYDDVLGFVGRYCGTELPPDVHSTGNVMTLKFLSDASVSDRGFRATYRAVQHSKNHQELPDLA